MRVLYYIPILSHTPKELGSLAAPILELESQTRGKNAVRAFIERSYKYWGIVRKKLEEAGLSKPETCQKLHIYVDGLPVGRQEEIAKIARALTDMKIPIYLLIEKLVQKGAQLHGTESKELLLREHQIWQKEAKGTKVSAKIKEKVLNARDRFVAENINQTLPEGDIGLLFMGRAHKVVEELDKAPGKFRVIFL